MSLPQTILRPDPSALALDEGYVLRLLGYREGQTRLGARHRSLVAQGIGLALEAARPALSLSYCAVSVEGDLVATRLPGLATWRSRSLARLLSGAFGITLVVATLGSGVEERVADLFAAEDYALATIVDAAGSALVQGLAEYARSQIPHGSLTPLYGPGYGDWAITDQIQLTEAAGGGGIGLQSTENCYLVPQKSLVGIIGWLAPGAPAARRSGCQLCTMTDCEYRLRL